MLPELIHLRCVLRVLTVVRDRRRWEGSEGVRRVGLSISFKISQVNTFSNSHSGAARPACESRKESMRHNSRVQFVPVARISTTFFSKNQIDRQWSYMYSVAPQRPDRSLSSFCLTSFRYTRLGTLAWWDERRRIPLIRTFLMLRNEFLI